MYAVILTGGKQYRVQPGDIIQVEKLDGEVGGKVKFDQVLFASKADGENAKIWLGKPTLSGASVDAEVVGQGRGDKITIVKMKRRKQYRRTKGHRQDYTQILVTAVANGSGESMNLADADKKAAMSKFQSHLTPRGGKQVAVKTAAAGTKAKAKPATSEKKTATKAKTTKKTTKA